MADDIFNHRDDIAKMIGPKIVYMLEKGMEPHAIEEIFDAAISMKITELTNQRRGLRGRTNGKQ